MAPTGVEPSPRVSSRPPATATAPAPATPLPVDGLAPAGPTETALVVRIADGDTITVELDGRRVTVRYIGIDTPELNSGGGADYLAREATAANERLVAGQVVHLERDVSETDRFGRLLRYVWLRRPNGWLMVNRQLVREGLAEARTYRPDTHWQDVLDQAELEARAEGIGLWAGGQRATPVPFLGGGCDAAYPGLCIPPPPPDLDCPDIAPRRFAVLPPDPHGFDGDHDGIGCEFLGTP